MRTYKLQFDNGHKFQTASKDLAEAQEKVVSFMDKNIYLSSCLITCQGKTSIVRRTGAWHPVHNGYSFGL